MKTPIALTLLRTKPWQYQTTYWQDGTARWDGVSGSRLGAWQGTVSPAWFERIGTLSTDLRASKKHATGDLTVVVETSSNTKTYTATEGGESESLWRLALLLDGLTTRTIWMPLDVKGDADFSPWSSGIDVSFAQRGCQARGLALPEGVLILAGSQVATTTSPSLEPPYMEQREALQADGSLTLHGDRFILNRHLHFRAPSAAASVISGSNTNGRHAWQDVSGRTWADFGWNV